MLGYRNVEIRVGDGTLGWPEQQPFDAILVSAGGPFVPDALKAQLALGGRLVIPVATEAPFQSLLKITRLSADTYDEQDLGGIRSVPLIGEAGWTEDGRRAASNHRPGNVSQQSLPKLIAAAADPLPAFQDPGFG